MEIEDLEEERGLEESRKAAAEEEWWEYQEEARARQVQEDIDEAWARAEAEAEEEWWEAERMQDAMAQWTIVPINEWTLEMLDKWAREIVEDRARAEARNIEVDRNIKEYRAIEDIEEKSAYKEWKTWRMIGEKCRWEDFKEEKAAERAEEDSDLWGERWEAEQDRLDAEEVIRRVRRRLSDKGAVEEEDERYIGWREAEESRYPFGRITIAEDGGGKVLVLAKPVEAKFGRERSRRSSSGRGC